MTGWGELYDGWEKDIPPQYEHRGPSLAEEAQVSGGLGGSIGPWGTGANTQLWHVQGKIIWLVVWNMTFSFSICWE